LKFGSGEWHLRATLFFVHRMRGLGEIGAFWELDKFFGVPRNSSF
jgi:hypothetical protein